MQKLLLLFGAVLLSVGANAQTRILFLGNSYTAVNSLPSLVYELAAAAGDTIVVDSNTPGGYTFNAHSTNATTLAKIASQDWDFVVLQEQSQIPSFSPGQVANDCYPYAQILVDSIRANNPCTEPVFYMTWGRKFGDQNNCASFPPVCTYDGMQWQLRRSYLELSQLHQATVAPVGMAWHTSIQADSALNLYTGDNSHPNIYGSYLAACTFYATFFEQTPVGNTYVPSGITAAEATFLQNAAANTVLDSTIHWRIGANQVGSNFVWLSSGNTIDFINQSVNATDYAWDFGDGNFSTQENPTHTFLNNGIYSVEMIASSACGVDTVTETFQVGPVGIEVYKESMEMKIFPNPASSILNVILTLPSSEQLVYSIYDISGRNLLHSTAVHGGGTKINQIAIDALAPGTYLLQVVGKKTQVQSTFIKQ